LQELLFLSIRAEEKTRNQDEETCSPAVISSAWAATCEQPTIADASTVNDDEQLPSASLLPLVAKAVSPQKNGRSHGKMS
jgi:hypothetical protein